MDSSGNRRNRSVNNDDDRASRNGRKRRRSRSYHHNVNTRKRSRGWDHNGSHHQDQHQYHHGSAKYAKTAVENGNHHHRQYQSKEEWMRERRRVRRWTRKRDRPGKRLRKLEQQQQQRHEHHYQRRRSGYANRQRRKESSSGSSSGSSYDDTIGAYNGKTGDVIADGYKVVKELGVGTFGRVLECVSIKQGEENSVRAVKVVRSVRKYLDSARIEAEILEHLNGIESGAASRGHRGRKEFAEFAKKNPKSMGNGKKRDTYCVRMHEWFEWDNHVCLVFDSLGPSLLDSLKRSDYRPMGLDVIRTVAYQTSAALKFLHEDCGLIHTDLKLENILFVADDHCEIVVSDQQPRSHSPWRCERGSGDDEDGDDSRPYDANGKAPSNSESAKSFIVPSDQMCEIRLIDFGGATYFDERGEMGCYAGCRDQSVALSASSDGSTGSLSSSSIANNNKVRTSIINTRQYRAPEVILQLGWSFPSDLWSLGCILMELFTGDLLFNTHENSEHLALIDRIVGPFPHYLAMDASRVRANYEFFTSNGRIKFPKHSTSRESADFVRDSPSLYRIIWGGSDSQHPYSHSKHRDLFCEKDSNRYTLFYDLVSTMLHIDPTKRVTAAEAMEHAFFPTSR